MFKEFDESLETFKIQALNGGFIINVEFTIEKEELIFNVLPCDKLYGISFPIKNNLTLNFFNRGSLFNYIDMNIRLREIIFSPISNEIIPNFQIISKAYYVTMSDLDSLQNGDFTVLKKRTQQFSTTIGKNFTNLVIFDKPKILMNHYTYFCN